jgi:hypothetical protein
MRLLAIKKSTNPQKKYMALFDNPKKTVHFGSAGMSDFTIHKDVSRKERYLKRHHARENWNDPTTPGSLSRWILWNKPNLDTAIKAYRIRFKL